MLLHATAHEPKDLFSSPVCHADPEPANHEAECPYQGPDIFPMLFGMMH